MSNLKSLKDYVLVEIKDRFRRETDSSGIDGKKIVRGIDEKDDYWTNQQVKTWGRVISVPKSLSRFPIAQDSIGHPHYVSYHPFHFKYRWDIEMEVQLGDKIYFHHNTLYAEQGKKNLIGKDGDKSIYKVAYEGIQCAVREVTEGPDKLQGKGYKEIIMIGSHCLIQPDMETWEEIMTPTFRTANGKPLTDQDGNPILNSEDKWLLHKVEPEARYLQGYVVAVGSPLKGDICEIERGDKIWYHKNADWSVRIEGQWYYMIKQRHIIAKLVK